LHHAIVNKNVTQHTANHTSRHTTHHHICTNIISYIYRSTYITAHNTAQHVVRRYGTTWNIPHDTTQPRTESHTLWHGTWYASNYTTEHGTHHSTQHTIKQGIWHLKHNPWKPKPCCGKKIREETLKRMFAIIIIKVAYGFVRKFWVCLDPRVECPQYNRRPKRGVSASNIIIMLISISSSSSYPYLQNTISIQVPTLDRLSWPATFEPRLAVVVLQVAQIR